VLKRQREIPETGEGDSAAAERDSKMEKEREPKITKIEKLFTQILIWSFIFSILATS